MINSDTMTLIASKKLINNESMGRGIWDKPMGLSSVERGRAGPLT